MRDNYDFTKALKNPYLKKLKKQISIRVNIDTIEYFKQLSEEVGIPYQKLMNFYLNDCAKKHKKPTLSWK